MLHSFLPRLLQLSKYVLVASEWTPSQIKRETGACCFSFILQCLDVIFCLGRCKQNIRALYSGALRCAVAHRCVLWLGVLRATLFSAILGWLAPNLYLNLIRCTCAPQRTPAELNGSKDQHQKHLFVYFFIICLRYKPCRHTYPPSDPFRIRETGVAVLK